MPALIKTDSTLRPDLATFAELDMEMQRRGYVGTRILPGFEVGKPEGKFGVIELKDLLANKDADTKRTSTGSYNESDYELKERSYQTEEHGWKERIDDRERQMYSDYFEGSSYDAEQVAANRSWEHVLHNLDKRVIKATITDLPAGQKAAASAVWSNAATADPIADIETACEEVWKRTGMWPDTVTMSVLAYRKLRHVQKVLERINSNGAGDRTMPRDVNLAKLAELFDVRQVVVAGAVGNTANRPKKAVLDTVFPKGSVLVSKAAQTNDFKEPCLGRTFHWGGDGSEIQGEDGRLIGVVEEYRNEDRRSDYVRVRHETDEFILYQEMGQVITGVLS
ncbi:MAG: major capsid protein [Planctomycetota bacterium]